jgi:TRAP-type C4-dicarboxylate transport system permease small subunit
MKRARKAAELAPSIIDRVSRALALTAGVLILVLVLMITYAVVSRKLFDAPLGFSLELSQYAMLAFVFLPLAWIQAQKGHIKIDLLTSRLSPRKQTILEIFASVAGLVFFALLAWQSWEIAWKSYELGLRSATTLRVPLFLPQVIVPIGSLLICLQFLIAIPRDIGSLVGRNPVVAKPGEEPSDSSLSHEG